MTDNEKIARWVGWNHAVPDYQNNDRDSTSLLDTLVKKRYDVRLQSFLDDPSKELWQCTIWSVYDGCCIVDVFAPTRSEAIVAADIVTGKQIGRAHV